MKILGIAGKARSGKNTTGELLKNSLKRNPDYNPYTMAFADAVKRTAQQMFSLTDEETWNDRYKDTVHPYWGITMREMFQKVGTEGGRDIFGHNLWVDRLRLEMAQIEDNSPSEQENVFIITDVRFPNEVQFIQMEGGPVWWIDREDDSELDQSSQQHSSENAISPIDTNLIITNYGTIDTLAKEVNHSLYADVL